MNRPVLEIRILLDRQTGRFRREHHRHHSADVRSSHQRGPERREEHGEATAGPFARTSGSADQHRLDDGESGRSGCHRQRHVLVQEIEHQLLVGRTRRGVDGCAQRIQVSPGCRAGRDCRHLDGVQRNEQVQGGQVEQRRRQRLILSGQQGPPEFRRHGIGAVQAQYVRSLRAHQGKVVRARIAGQGVHERTRCQLLGNPCESGFQCLQYVWMCSHTRSSNRTGRSDRTPGGGVRPDSGTGVIRATSCGCQSAVPLTRPAHVRVRRGVERSGSRRHLRLW